MPAVRPSRRAYLDWLRGIAVVCMIEWHVLDAWTVTAGRDRPIWIVLQVIGGMAAPLFLFLAGLAVPFAIDSHRRRGAEPRQAAWLVQRRGWQVFGLAHLFRFQSFLINPNARWSSILKPDILNIMGLGLAGTSWLVGRAGAGARRGIWWLLLPAAIVIALTPFARLWWWPTLLYPRFEAYIRPVGNYGVFTLFPWVALVPVGAFVGLLLAGERDDAAEVRLHRRLAMTGAALAALGFALGAIGNPAIAFWTSRWSVFLAQVGLMTVAIWAAWAWMPTRAATLLGASPLVLFGRTSLFVYWIHVELAYGMLSYPLHKALPLPWAMVGLVAMFGLMYLAARWWSGRQLTTNN